MRLVLDTDVVVASFRSPRGASAELLRRIDDGRATMLISVALLLEYESQCMLAEHRLAAGASLAEAGNFINALVAIAQRVHMYFRWRPQLNDPGDELVLEAAVNGEAAAIVTFNERDFRNAKESFGIDIIRPAEALRRI